MKIFAIRDKETGRFAPNYHWHYRHTADGFEDRFDGALPIEGMSVYNTKEAAEIGQPDHYEVVTLRIEPTEPCLWCEGKIEGEMRTKGELVDTYHSKATSWNFCPMCGRSLT